MSMTFCKECNNLMYPRENRAEKKLEYFCKICSFVERNITDPRVFLNEIVKDVSTKLDVIPSDVNKDPTLQRNQTTDCYECGHNESVFFQAEQHAKSTALSLIYVCTKCGHKWMDEEHKAK